MVVVAAAVAATTARVGLTRLWLLLLLLDDFTICVQGGAIYNAGSITVIRDCGFTTNTAVGHENLH